MAPFEEKSPFRGLTVPEDVKVNRQVLADPTVAMDAEVWATLADGTPLVTAAKQGDGWVVLFHITANSDWSNLPLSGLFVEMLRRVVTLGPSQVGPHTGERGATLEASTQAPGASSATALPPIQTLDGYGQLTTPPLRAAPIAPDKIDTMVPSPDHPPGYYGPSGAARAFNIITAKTVLDAAAHGRRRHRARRLHAEEAARARAVALSCRAPHIRRRHHRRARARAPACGCAAAGRRASAAVLLAFAFLPATLDSAQAQQPTDDTASALESQTGNSVDDFALKASLTTRLAYVVTGNAEIDRTSQEGLSGLSKVLRARTALEPADPMGVDIDKDELSFFPVLYWPVREDAEPLSDETLAKIDAFMKQGGLIIFDTRDHETPPCRARAQNKR